MAWCCQQSTRKRAEKHTSQSDFTNDIGSIETQSFKDRINRAVQRGSQGATAEVGLDTLGLGVLWGWYGRGNGSQGESRDDRELHIVLLCFGVGRVL